MSSEKQNTSKPTPPRDWKAEVDKQWQKISQFGSDFYLKHQENFSLKKVSAILGGGLAFACPWEKAIDMAINYITKDPQCK